MRKAIEFVGIITILVVIFSACDADNTDEGVKSGALLKINGLPGSGNFTVFVFNSGTDISSYAAAIGAFNSGNYQAVGEFSSGNVFEMYAWNGTERAGGWTGSGGFPVILLNSSGSITDAENPMYRHATVVFSNGNAEVHFNIFTAAVQNEDTVPQIGVTVSIEQIIDGTPLPFGSIRISRTGTGFPVTETVSVNASGFDNNIIWEVAGVGHFANETVIGHGSSFTLNAADIRYNSLGGHTLVLTVRKDGMRYQRVIPFTIMQ